MAGAALVSFLLWVAGMRRLLLALGCALAACSTHLDATHYDQSCSTAADCVAVFNGDVCSVCACPNAAINAKDKSRYDADDGSLQRYCGPRPAVACISCPTPMVACVGGKCAESH
jgi:hypothetical protein